LQWQLDQPHGWGGQWTIREEQSGLYLGYKSGKGVSGAALYGVDEAVPWDIWQAPTIGDHYQ